MDIQQQTQYDIHQAARDGKSKDQNNNCLLNIPADLSVADIVESLLSVIE